MFSLKKSRQLSYGALSDTILLQWSTVVFTCKVVLQNNLIYLWSMYVCTTSNKNKNKSFVPTLDDTCNCGLIPN